MYIYYLVLLSYLHKYIIIEGIYYSYGNNKCKYTYINKII